MLELYGRIGRALYKVRILPLSGAVVGAGFFVVAITDPDPGAREARLLLPLMLTLWCLCTTVLAYGFSGSIPQVDPGMGWRGRIATRAKRALWHGLALVVTGLGGATVLFTLRAIAIMFRESGGP